MFACPAEEATFTSRLAPFFFEVFAGVETVNFGLERQVRAATRGERGGHGRRGALRTGDRRGDLLLRQLVGLKMNPGRFDRHVDRLHAQRHAVDDLRQRIARDRQRAVSRIDV